MAYNNGIVTYPVTDSDFKNALSVNSGDLATCVAQGTYNMWAKYKHVAWPNVNTLAALDPTTKTWNPSAAAADQWWKAFDGSFGLGYAAAKVDISSPATSGATQMINALKTLLTKIDGGNNGWTYFRPAGGANAPYRYLDLLQYNRNAPIPIRSVSADDAEASASSEYSVFVKMLRSEMIDITRRDYIIPEDLTSITLYTAIAIFKQNGNTYDPIAWVSDGTVWEGMGINSSSGADGIQNASTMDNDQYVIAKLKDGQTYYALPFFATKVLAQPEANRSAAPTASQPISLITAPYTSLVSFTATQLPSGQLIGKPTISNRAITNLWTFATTLKLDSTVAGYHGGTATHVTLAVVNELFDGTFATGNYAYQNDFGSVTVGPSEVVTVGSTGTLILDSAHTWRVVVWVSGSFVTFSLRSPLQPTP
jgi:hypothetical protein